MRCRAAMEGRWNGAQVNEEHACFAVPTLNDRGANRGDARDNCERAARKMKGKRRACKQAFACRSIHVQNSLRALWTSSFVKSRILAKTSFKSGMEGVFAYQQSLDASQTHARCAQSIKSKLPPPAHEC